MSRGAVWQSRSALSQRALAVPYQPGPIPLSSGLGTAGSSSGSIGRQKGACAFLGIAAGGIHVGRLHLALPPVAREGVEGARSSVAGAGSPRSRVPGGECQSRRACRLRGDGSACRSPPARSNRWRAAAAFAVKVAMTQCSRRECRPAWTLNSLRECETPVQRWLFTLRDKQRNKLR